MHIYAFGSICRGEIDAGSDVDLLALVDRSSSPLDPSMFSIYSYPRLRQLWNDGNPFAWHLATESRILYSRDGDDFIKKMGQPNQYKNGATDCRKFQQLFRRAQGALESGAASPVYELSAIFLAIRNFATCYALGYMSECIFSRTSARQLRAKSLSISDQAFAILERSRLLSTRGYGTMIVQQDIAAVMQEMTNISEWMRTRIEEVS